MPFDIDGYGFSDDDPIERLTSDVRTMSPASIERAASGWDRFATGDHVRFEKAHEKAARAVEKNGRGPAFDQIRGQLFGLTESAQALVSWQAEHGPAHEASDLAGTPDNGIAHKAERAACAAALALIVDDLLDEEEFRALLRPMGEVLPWLDSTPRRTRQPATDTAD